MSPPAPLHELGAVRKGLGAHVLGCGAHANSGIESARTGIRSCKRLFTFVPSYFGLVFSLFLEFAALLKTDTLRFDGYVLLAPEPKNHNPSCNMLRNIFRTPKINKTTHGARGTKPKPPKTLPPRIVESALGTCDTRAGRAGGGQCTPMTDRTGCQAAGGHGTTPCTRGASTVGKWENMCWWGTCDQGPTVDTFARGSSMSRSRNGPSSKYSFVGCGCSACVWGSDVGHELSVLSVCSLPAPP